MPVATVSKRSRKRHDPDAGAPIDGVFRPDLVINKRSGYRYYWLTPEDAAVKYELGARKVARTPDGPRMKFDTSDPANPDITFRGLTLYEMPEKLAREYDKYAVDQNIMKGRAMNAGDKAKGLSEAPDVWEN